jgi:hypothetical protein
VAAVSNDSAFWLARIAAVDLVIAQFDAVLLAFATNGLQQSYSYDTGQSVVRVERADITKIQENLDALINQRGIYCIRAGLSRTGVTGVPV